MKLAKSNIKPKKLWIISLITVVALLFIGAVGFQVWYASSLQPVSSINESRLFVVDQGSSAQKIAENLKTLNLIRSPRAFIFYINSKNYKRKLQAGTYKFSPSMSSQTIAKSLATGRVDKNWLTILPGKRLDQTKQEFISSGYTAAEVEAAFNPAIYAGDPALASLPAGASLEGYLYPDSFQKVPSTPAADIVKESIDELQTKLTPDIASGFAAQGLSTYQGITLASIVLKESGSQDIQPTIAQVFLSRLKQGMMLGSDVTAFYASAIAGVSPTVTIDSPYNTRVHAGLPPGPIGNVTQPALEAVAHPASTDYLFFVAGDDGVVHFSHTEAEHEAAVKQYCKKLCQ